MYIKSSFIQKVCKGETHVSPATPPAPAPSTITLRRGMEYEDQLEVTIIQVGWSLLRTQVCSPQQQS